MKKLTLILFVIFIPLFVKSQIVTEKLLYKSEIQNNLDVYSFKIDEKSGTFVYINYDTTKTLKSSVISNRGNSDDYDYINSYSTIFDDNGNYYLIASKNLTDSTGKNYFLKNGSILLTCDYINPDLVLFNGKIYMMCTDNYKSFIASYNMTDGMLSKGKEYDEINLCQFDKYIYEGEPIGKIGISKKGEIYYLARLDNKTFLVIGDKEQEKFSDIDAYYVNEDKEGNFAFVAKDTGSFMHSGGIFVVHGDKKYKPFYGIYNLILDDYGNAIYIANDSSSTLYPQRVMRGDKEISNIYNGGVSYLNVTPEGKIYYVASNKKKNSDEYESFFVFDGKKHKSYSSIYNLKLFNNYEPVYIAQQSEDKYYVVKGDKEFPIEKTYNVLSADILKDGTLSYVTIQYGDYEKKIKDKNYVYIGNNKFGPYDGLYMIDYKNSSYVISDKNGNYAYVVNAIKNFSDYYYVLYTNTKKSEEFENIFDVNLYNGKVLFSSFHLDDKINYTYKYRIYYDFKPITPEYDSLNEYKFDEETGNVSFYVSKGNEIYKVEVKL